MPIPSLFSSTTNSSCPYLRRKEKGEDVAVEQVRREFLERPDRAANILAPLEDQCRWLREIGFSDVDCFWEYFELAIFGGRKFTCSS